MLPSSARVRHEIPVNVHHTVRARPLHWLDHVAYHLCVQRWMYAAVQAALTKPAYYTYATSAKNDHVP